MVSEIYNGIVFCAFLLPADSLVGKVKNLFSARADGAIVAGLSSSDLKVTRLSCSPTISKDSLDLVDIVQGLAMPSSLQLK